MTHDKGNFSEYQNYGENDRGTNVFLGDNTVIPAEGEGKVELLSSGNGQETSLSLNKVLHVPQLAKNLLSVPALTQTGARVLFDKDNCHVIKDDEKHTIGTVRDGKLYKVNCPIVAKQEAEIGELEATEYANVTETAVSRSVWHSRLGHLNYKYIDDLCKKNLVSGLKFSDVADENANDNCESCILGKMVRSSCPKQSLNRAANCFEVIHTDLCGPMQVDSVGGSKYLLSFTDDYSRYM